MNSNLPAKGINNNQINELYKINISDEVISKIIARNNKKKKLAEIIQIIEKNPETLEKLDVIKLEIIDRYYKHEIKKYRTKIANVS